MTWTSRVASHVASTVSGLVLGLAAAAVTLALGPVVLPVVAPVVGPAVSAGGFLSAQLPPQPSQPLSEAFFAWSEGRYTDALNTYLRVLDAAGDPGIIEEIAVLTGELYTVHEVTTDGLEIAASPDGRYLGYVVETADGRETHIVQVTPGSPPTEVARVDGGSFSLGADAAVAYRTGGDEARLAAPMAAMEAARQRQSTLEFRVAEMEARWVEATTSELRVLNVGTGAERTIDTAGRVVVDWVLGENGVLWVAAAEPDATGTTGLFRVGAGETGLTEVAAPDGYKDELIAVPGGRSLVYSVPTDDPAPQRPGAVRQQQSGEAGVGVFDIASGVGRSFRGEDPAVSADGSLLAWVRRPSDFVPNRLRFPHGSGGEILSLRLTSEGGPVTAYATERPVGPPAPSPDGTSIAVATMPGDDWEVFVVPSDGSPSIRRMTDEVQHDQFPVFLSRGTILAMKGEGRHRRSYLYDVAGGQSLKLFHNNTVRTIAPEYEWVVSPNADWIGVVAERDGDTVSPERGVYVVDLTATVSREELRARLESQLAGERALQDVAARVFDGIGDSVRVVTEPISAARIHEYARTLYSFGSKFVTEPGNQTAVRYIADRLREFGYDPEIQTFQALGVRTSNVIASLPGLTDPTVTYVVASHFDSHQRGPGADDNTSGTTALLEIARVMRDHAQGVTLQFAFLTGEEAGLLGARHYVGELRSQGVYLAGALNNDMVGWANDHRLDNTIRYSNDGIRDIQHAAAMSFSRLITYDARYFKNTDAHAFFEAYGDIVGGIGSYPVLGNPHYHQSTDRLQTINHDLVAEVARTTAATVMALAAHPSPPRGLDWQRGTDGSTRVRWDQTPERDVVEYLVRYRATASDPWTEEQTTATRIDLPELPDGAVVEVKGVSRTGVEGWDWGTVTVGPVGGSTSASPGTD